MFIPSFEKKTRAALSRLWAGLISLSLEKEEEEEETLVTSGHRFLLRERVPLRNGFSPIAR